MVVRKALMKSTNLKRKKCEIFINKTTEIFSSSHYRVHDVKKVAAKVYVTKNRKFCDKSLKKALLECSEGTSINTAAKNNNICRSTLWRHSNGQVYYNSPGVEQLIPSQYETILVDWIEEGAEAGEPRTKGQVVAAASSILTVISKDDRNLTLGWLKRFVRRHPSVTFQKYQPTARKPAQNKEEFCSKFDDWLKEKGFLHLMSDPTQSIKLN